MGGTCSKDADMINAYIFNWKIRSKAIWSCGWEGNIKMPRFSVYIYWIQLALNIVHYQKPKQVNDPSDYMNREIRGQLSFLHRCAVP